MKVLITLTDGSFIKGNLDSVSLSRSPDAMKLFVALKLRPSIILFESERREPTDNWIIESSEKLIDTDNVKEIEILDGNTEGVTVSRTRKVVLSLPALIASLALIAFYRHAQYGNITPAEAKVFMEYAAWSALAAAILIWIRPFQLFQNFSMSVIMVMAFILLK